MGEGKMTSSSSVHILIGFSKSAETFIAHPDLDYGKRPHATVPIDWLQQIQVFAEKAEKDLTEGKQ
jgi:hypothetical protein